MANGFTYSEGSEMINRRNINWDEINEASRMLKEAGFEEVCGSMTSTPFSGEVPAYDSNFGTDYTLYPYTQDQDMTPDQRGAWREYYGFTLDDLMANQKEFDSGCISLTLNYVSAADIIEVLS